MKYAAPVMKRQGSGVIVSNSAIGAFFTGYGSHIYCATKAAVVQLTRSVAAETLQQRERLKAAFGTS